ncbi:transcriptional regulator [Paenibacillus sp. PDC88]|uniref:transcriptional regulator n=1 Tax=Paenibacillus TaxID=44249 RepID=UPI000895D92B|nr:transcriptional regulator [Paenibacillus sp. PDC88]SDX82499.1 hypothetical protein SAMN05518848_11810 [Paenibacillus sp. PDC88]
MSNNVWLSAVLSGEMRPAEIPAAPGIDVAAIKAGDNDPMEVVVEVPAGKSTRGWNYTAESLNAIVKHVNQQTLSGFLGHQKPDEVETAFERPVTHWIGARMENGRAYFRGVIDAAAQDLKRWIRAGRIKQVSIYGMPKLQTVGGETQVIDYKPLSIDWTPLNRSGMPTRIVAIGEMDVIRINNSPSPEGGVTNVPLLQLKEQIQSGKITLEEVLRNLSPEEATKRTTALSIIGQMKTLLEVQSEAELIPALQKALQGKTASGEMSIRYDPKRESILHPDWMLYADRHTI